MFATYATDYDLAVAADRFHDLQQEMKSIRYAQAAQARKQAGPSLIDRLFGLVSRGTRLPASQGKVGAPA